MHKRETTGSIAEKLFSGTSRSGLLAFFTYPPVSFLWVAKVGVCLCDGRTRAVEDYVYEVLRKDRRRHV